MYINFQQNWVKTQVMTVLTSYSQKKIASCINLQLAIRISKNQAVRTCTTPLPTFRPILRSIDLLDIEIPEKNLFSQTTDGRADGKVFSKKENKY